MAVTREIQDAWIQCIKDCGQSLIDNAEEIAGNYEFQTGVKISIDLAPGEMVQISITTTYLPKATNGKHIVAHLPVGDQEITFVNAVE